MTKLDRPERLEAVRYTKQRIDDVLAWLRRHNIEHMYDGDLYVNGDLVNRDEYIAIATNFIEESKVMIFAEWSYMTSVKGGVRDTQGLSYAAE